MGTLTLTAFTLCLPLWLGCGEAVSEASTCFNTETKETIWRFCQLPIMFISVIHLEMGNDPWLGLDPVDPLWAGPEPKFCLLPGSCMPQIMLHFTRCQSQLRLPSSPSPQCTVTGINGRGPLEEGLSDCDRGLWLRPHQTLPLGESASSLGSSLDSWLGCGKWGRGCEFV